MPNLGGIFRGTASLTPPTDPTIYNVSVPLANTEVSQALSPKTKRFTIRVRGTARLQLAYGAGESSTDFVTIPPGNTRDVVGIDFSGTLYFQCSQAAQVVEIEEWV